MFSSKFNFQMRNMMWWRHHNYGPNGRCSVLFRSIVHNLSYYTVKTAKDCKNSFMRHRTRIEFSKLMENWVALSLLIHKSWLILSLFSWTKERIFNGCYSGIQSTNKSSFEYSAEIQRTQIEKYFHSKNICYIETNIHISNEHKAVSPHHQPRWQTIRIYLEMIEEKNAFNSNETEKHQKCT